MGAALHLAHVQQAMPPSRKRKGGGGSGDGYDALVARVYGDDRHTTESRDLILLMAWLAGRDPERHTTELGFWTRAGNVLGLYKSGSRTRPRLADLVAKDLPRYEPDYRSDAWQRHACAAPMIRRDGECGKHATNHTLTYDTNGWISPVWYCSRHADWGRKQDIAAREARKTAPPPLPNAGGLMPSYFSHKTGPEGWTDLYEWASKWTYSGWKPPEPYGLCADNWPLPDREAPSWEPPRLRLATRNGELVGP
ncbi:hypothetical protein [Streptomyces caniscabiei]|uniref:Uncharacterized protein n=1 Tax=Streptomyces caniscabiei TaxID=2746961 RepID=A0ABU4N0Q8_9ACTN|nr:hypothetical protein [Streptomyces caniscabiei]MBE4790272.1 hypothetical protein [Streptomyces caniscabiei]MBE4799499.1 hypothetical protein [Streptomyces caniscabiei]MDX3015129.1 hypothetical protein [Streptomyces caniscabiei]MDX3042572.1 hypothetical protein [Streptomyces caniscabiei]